MPLRGRNMVFPPSYGDSAPVTPYSELDQERDEHERDRVHHPDCICRACVPVIAEQPSERERAEHRAARVDELQARRDTRPHTSAIGDVVPLRRRTPSTNESSAGLSPDAA